MVYIFCIHRWKYNDKTCWNRNCSKKGGEGWGRMIEGVNLTKIYCKHTCKCHSVSPVQPFMVTVVIIIIVKKYLQSRRMSLSSGRLAIWNFSTCPVNLNTLSFCCPLRGMQRQVCKWLSLGLNQGLNSWKRSDTCEGIYNLLQWYPTEGNHLTQESITEDAVNTLVCSFLCPAEFLSLCSTPWCWWVNRWHTCYFVSFGICDGAALCFCACVHVILLQGQCTLA
jgi:hypothetical protein